MSARIEATQTFYDRYDPDPLNMGLARKINARLGRIIAIKIRG
jgi:hypothetical protein